MINWIFWTIPDYKLQHYFILMFMILVLIPKLLGVQFTTLGYLMNYILFDFLYYRMLIIEEKIRERMKDDD